MSRRPPPLTDMACRKAVRSISDPDHLKLIVRTDKHGTLRKFWKVTKVKITREDGDGKKVAKETSFGLGEYPRISLAEARTLRDAKLRQVRAGDDPAALKRQSNAAAKDAKAKPKVKAHTLQAFATAHHRTLIGGFRNPKHRSQWLSSLALHVFPTLGGKAITDGDWEPLLLDLLGPLIQRLPESGERVAQRLRSVFDAAKKRKIISVNPMREIAGAAELKRPKIAKKHLRAMDYSVVPEFITALRAYRERLKSEEQPIVTALALELVVLCASRSGEVRGMMWSEVSVDNKVWAIPAERMKAGIAHTITLPDVARTIVKTMREAKVPGKGDNLVFPSPLTARMLSDMSFTMTMRRLETGATITDYEGNEQPETFGDLGTPHGFRSAFSRWSNKIAKMRADVIEACLAHKLPGGETRLDYLRDETYDDERAALLQRWSDYVTGKDKVVAGRSRIGTEHGPLATSGNPVSIKMDC
jgi:integrase